MLYPLKFEPVLKEKVWGGRALERRLGKDLPLEKRIGESWELSTVEGSVSVISNGEFAGRTLAGLIEEFPGEVMGDLAGTCEGFPLLYKFIDALDDLSVQVHPDAAAAASVPGAREKSEGWFVVHSEPGARLIVGLEPGVSREDFKRMLDAGGIEDALHSVDVKAGDAVFIPAGTVHAICRGVLLYEVQQASDTTFRVWDYNRPGLDGNPRELHVAEALDAIRFGKPAPSLAACAEAGRLPDRKRVFDNDFFILETLSCGEDFAWPYRGKVPRTVSVIAGSGRFTGKFGEVEAAPGCTLLMPASCVVTEFNADGPIEMLVSWPK